MSSAELSVVIPNWNGIRWLPACLDSIARQESAPGEVIVVDNGSRDGSREFIATLHPGVKMIELPHNTGFAHAANVGMRAAASEIVALLNTDVVLEPDWVSRMVAALEAEPDVASVACKLLSLEDRRFVYDAGDILRRDGVCEQRGRFLADTGRWDQPGEVFGACAAAAVYRREAVLSLGGFDERYFAYLEDVDLALRLRLAGWRCRYEPAVALHAGEGSASRLEGGHHYLVARNTLVLVAKAFPVRWLGLVAYRQLGSAWHSLLERRLRRHLRGLVAALPMLPRALRERRALRRNATIPIELVVPSRPIRRPRAAVPSPGVTPR
jgi:GT2 family glycosyltransferase